MQRLSNARLREARILFAAGEYSGANYPANCAVEFGLKAWFPRSVKRYDFPDKDLTGMRLGGQKIGNRFIDDAYVYRVVA